MNTSPSASYGPGVSASVESSTFLGHPALVLQASHYEVVFLPSLGMVGASLRWHGAEFVAFDADAYAAGHTSGIPLLYPWANRLSAPAYKAVGRSVAFALDPPVHVIDGLPIHGTMTAHPRWTVTDQSVADGVACAAATCAFDTPDLLASFPFPHDLEIRARLGVTGLAITTVVHASRGEAVPVSFGWHPYLALPGAKRPEISVVLPTRAHLGLDARMLPTGTATDESATSVALGAPDDPDRVTFDDAYRLDDDRVLAVEGGGHRVTAAFDANFPYAQVYAPAGQSLACLEPMTAPIDALVRGDHPVVAAGTSWSATFTLAVSSVTGV